jgi:integrase
MVLRTPSKQADESRGVRGGGSIFKPKYRAKNDEIRESRIWWIKYHKYGRPLRESSESEKRAVAERLLRRRLGEIEAGISSSQNGARRLRYENLRETLLFDYKTNKRKSLLKRLNGTEYICGLPVLDNFFCNSHIADIETPRIREFIAKRTEEGVPNATINRSLALLRRMFHLAKQDGRLRFIPHFPMLNENNVRKGFLVHDQYTLVRNALPEYLVPVLAMGYFSGMREGEILPLLWTQVSFKDNHVHLDPGTTKNDEPRTVPLASELRAILKMQFQRRNLECPDCPFVFFHGGKRIVSFRKAWRNTCVRLGLGRFTCLHCGSKTVGTKRCAPCSKLRKKDRRRYEGLLFHDLRRTGVRNLIRAGVPEKVAMRISGHKTREVFDRYNIVSERDLKDAARKLDSYVENEFGQSLGKVGDLEASEDNAEKQLNPSVPKRRDWLGGLDSNQDSQIQSLESYQLDDLPILLQVIIMPRGFHLGQTRHLRPITRQSGPRSAPS